ncbi:MAG: peptide-methionine (S)-S-oxide reductase MsrA [Wenzhouxiangellaceae bacterium]
MNAGLKHYVNDRCLESPYPDGMAIAEFGLGCFWGAERAFWTQSGVYVTAVGYAGGEQANPDYRSVCSGQTGHAEVVRVVYNPEQISYASLLQVFWEAHDPTQGMRQGNDIGTQYRSIIITHDAAQAAMAQRSRNAYQQRLQEKGRGQITTQLISAAQAPFYFAEDYHQQYLAKNPGGYCGLGGTGVSCPAPRDWEIPA